MKKVLVFENEADLIKGAFDLFNILRANNSIEFSYKTSSQDLDPIDSINDYDFVFVDLSLSQNSEEAGTTLIERILSLEKHPNVAIITGKSKPEEILEEKGLAHIPLIKKPISKDLHHDKLFKLLFPS